LQKKGEEKKQILQDIFSFWFNKDILIEIREAYKFNNFLKQLAIRNGNLLNINEIAKEI
jgi:predicted AAA+ superfamily ATPase